MDNRWNPTASLPGAFPVRSFGLQRAATSLEYRGFMAQPGPRPDGDRPGTGDHQLVTSPQLPGEPHTPRSPVGPGRPAEGFLDHVATEASAALRGVAARSAKILKRREEP